MISKERLKVIITEWISPLFKGPERNLNGYFWWLPEPKTGVSKMSISLNQISQIGGDKYYIYIDGFKDHPVIVIDNDTVSLHLERSFNFSKSSLRFLYDKINRELDKEPEVDKNEYMGPIRDINDTRFPVAVLRQVEQLISEWFHRKGDKNVKVEKHYNSDLSMQINWISNIMSVELRSSYNFKNEFVGYDIFAGKPISAHPFILMRLDDICFNKTPEGFMISPFLERYMCEIFEMIKRSDYIDHLQKYHQVIRDLKKIANMMDTPIITAVQKTRIKGEENTMTKPEIKKFFYSGRTTVVIWDDGTKTMSSPSGDETFDPEMGLAMAVAKKYFGNRHKFEKVVADALYGKYLDDYKKMFVDKWTKNFKTLTDDGKIHAYTQALNALIDVRKNIRKHIDEELKKHEVNKKEFEKKLEEYEEAVAAGKKPKRPVLKSHRTPEMRDLQVRLKAVKDFMTLIEQRIKKLEG